MPAGRGTQPFAILHRVKPGNCKDRKSTRLNSSHSQISYAVFCLKKKKNLQHDDGSLLKAWRWKRRAGDSGGRCALRLDAVRRGCAPRAERRRVGAWSRVGTPRVT